MSQIFWTLLKGCRTTVWLEWAKIRKLLPSNYCANDFQYVSAITCRYSCRFTSFWVVLFLSYRLSYKVDHRSQSQELGSCPLLAKRKTTKNYVPGYLFSNVLVSFHKTPTFGSTVRWDIPEYISSWILSSAEISYGTLPSPWPITITARNGRNRFVDKSIIYYNYITTPKRLNMGPICATKLMKKQSIS